MWTQLRCGTDAVGGDIIILGTHSVVGYLPFSALCIECNAVWVIVKPSVCPSDTCIVTKQKHLAKKSSVMTNRKSTTSFPMSLG